MWFSPQRSNPMHPVAAHEVSLRMGERDPTGSPLARRDPGQNPACLSGDLELWRPVGPIGSTSHAGTAKQRHSLRLEGLCLRWRDLDGEKVRRGPSQPPGVPRRERSVFCPVFTDPHSPMDNCCEPRLRLRDRDGLRWAGIPLAQWARLGLGSPGELRISSRSTEAQPVCATK